ncbi:hypothetical protein ASL14_26260 (plasmid) [Paenibacillus sp. IHB B 3084]|uniref:hypothetical protein n=1 Tax=Paenibacillus sp. IHB B 3084 TaxID=867076 RepID=UPI000720792E|nr:hypothetical protein [Paenibacillus sp. IHB B 3084]ALP39383.1 hypothetical protein ASL14_26260 [Paenibacillus sp. IHB B 3084]
MLNEKIIVRVSQDEEGKTVGIAWQDDTFIFRNPPGPSFEGVEYLTCYKLGRSDFIEPFKRSTESRWLEQEEKYQVYLQELHKQYIPVLQAYCRENRNDMELAWSIMEKHGIESSYKGLTLFSFFLKMECKKIEGTDREDNEEDAKFLDQIYEMRMAVARIFEVRAFDDMIETDSIYFKTDDATFMKGYFR